MLSSAHLQEDLTITDHDEWHLGVVIPDFGVLGFMYFISEVVFKSVLCDYVHMLMGIKREFFFKWDMAKNG